MRFLSYHHRDNTRSECSSCLHLKVEETKARLCLQRYLEFRIFSHMFLNSETGGRIVCYHLVVSVAIHQ